MKVLEFRTSQPTFSPEEIQECECRGEHDPDRHRIAPFPMQFRHVIKIHAVQTGDKTERHEDGGNDRQCSHDFVRAVTQF